MAEVVEEVEAVGLLKVVEVVEAAGALKAAEVVEAVVVEAVEVMELK